MSDTNTECAPNPATAQHAWLKKFLGSWIFEGEAQTGPDQPPFQFSGTEDTVAVGDLWVVGAGAGAAMPFFYRLTLGYDPKKSKVVGSWVDSMHAHLWVYEGGIEGETLVLETEGPAPCGQLTKFRETTEFPDPSTRIFTSSIMTPEGDFAPLMRITFRRKS